MDKKKETTVSGIPFPHAWHTDELFGEAHPKKSLITNCYQRHSGKEPELDPTQNSS